jgi:hypothetical protein
MSVTKDECLHSIIKLVVTVGPFQKEAMIGEDTGIECSHFAQS